jgi:DNA polymerase-1
VTLHLVDGNGYLHRAYHASTGRGPVAAVAVYTQMLDKLEREQQPQRAAVVLDARGRTWRHELYAEYKATRPPMDAALVAQLDRFGPATRALGWPVISIRGFEADDVIATLASRARDRGWPVRVHASDKDLLALVDDLVHQVDARGAELGPAEVERKLGVPPGRVADWLAICGDASDNIPGVAGAGEKTAAELVRRFADVESLIAANPKIRGRYPLSTLEGVEALRMSRRLVELARNVDVDVGLEALVLGRRDEQAMRAALAPPEQLGLGGVPQATPAPAPQRPPFVSGHRDRLAPRRSTAPAVSDDEEMDIQERTAIRIHLGGQDPATALRDARVEVLNRPSPRRSA